MLASILRGVGLRIAVVAVFVVGAGLWYQFGGGKDKAKKEARDHVENSLPDAGKCFTVSGTTINYTFTPKQCSDAEAHYKVAEVVDDYNECEAKGAIGFSSSYNGKENASKHACAVMNVAVGDCVKQNIIDQRLEKTACPGDAVVTELAPATDTAKAATDPESFCAPDALGAMPNTYDKVVACFGIPA